MSFLNFFSTLFAGAVKEKDKGQEEPREQPIGSGYLGYFDLLDWYNSQPKAIQKFLYKSCGYGINTDSKSLLQGKFISIGADEDPLTATKFLCNHAMNAYRERLPGPFEALVNEARNRINSEKDREYYIAIRSHPSDGVTPKPSGAEIKKIKSAMIEMIRREPGYLQSALRKAFPDTDQEAVGLAISKINHEGLVRREKKGNSFRLFLADD